jgi:hypothetical protein
VYPQSTILRSRKSPFRSRPSWAIRKPAPGTPQPIVEALQQTTSPVDAVDIFRGMAETCSWPALNGTNKLGIPLLIQIGLDGPVRLSKTTWFSMAATTTVSDTVQSGTGHISNNPATSAVLTERQGGSPTRRA